MAAVVVLVVAFLLVGGFCTWVYFRREFAVQRRASLLAARLVAVAGVVALLWNPVVAGDVRGGGPDRYVIVDASASMGARTANGEAVWESALGRARAWVDDGARLLVVDAGVPAVAVDSLNQLAPSAVSSRLSEAVAVAAEAGAREVVLITDRRLDDPVATAVTAQRLGVGLAVDTLPQAASNLGLGRLVLPASGVGGEAVRGRVELDGATDQDSATVTVTIDDEPWQSLRIAAPARGGTRSVDIDLGTTLAAGTHTVAVRLQEPDAFALDDERTAIVRIDPEETGVLLVSFSADWEPRFLLPVLDQVTGLPVRGFVQTGPSRYQPMDARGANAIDAAAMGRLLRRAEMVVAMGVDASVTEFLERATARTSRLLIFARDAAGAAGAGVAVGGALPGEWYPDEAPPSPIAGEVARFAGAGLPPLTRILPVVDDTGGSALHVRLGGQGEPEAAVVLRSEGGRRRGVVLAQGFWRWAFRGAEAREHYRRLWSAIGGWMMADEPVAAGPGVRPARPVLQQGLQAPWLAHGYEGERIALAIADGTGNVALDTTLTIPQPGRFGTPALESGTYAYQVVLQADDSASAASDSASAAAPGDTIRGSFHVEAFTDEMLQLPADPGELTVRAAGARETAAANRPLRTTPYPYVLILGALCAEWIGRRRAGLR